ncbi:4'-phosphopantetheinyl transferase [Amycolatopsis xylanica]|uniref:4'-phosphopantetheinyl transferase n=1 Tax=Amycolatopsis xylanica TaxID=589385 RepID=A0A1H2Y6D5_9PSEU|nr:4'-phosphopantetheinyl transferase superfamily protein [Amycolatopsis xylanica]SDX00773.1 4'-phosphopantetheinyl transferase [Amycolatopsis xylanica]
MIDCAVWWAEPLPNEPRFIGLLDELELGRHAGYRQEIDQRRFLTGRVLAKTIAGERLGRAPADIVFDASCDDCDKPHGVPKVPGLALSISHSGDRIGLAVTSGAPVGLDVESASRRAEDSLIEYALNETERLGLKGLEADERASAFFVYWTRKEAVMKATGRGLRIPLHSITLAPFDAPAALLASSTPALDPATTRMADLDPGSGYRAAVAVLTTEDLAVTEHSWHP